MGRRAGVKDGGFEPTLALGMRKVMVQGNSHLRKLSYEALANLHCAGRFHDWDIGIFRITMGGGLAKLDDCRCQHVAIGSVHFLRLITVAQIA